MDRWLIAADIANPRRLRRIARIFERNGLRIQESVYLMTLTHADLQALQAELAVTLDHRADTVRYYPICGHDLRRSCGEGICTGLRDLPSSWVI